MATEEHHRHCPTSCDRRTAAMTGKTTLYTRQRFTQVESADMYKANCITAVGRGWAWGTRALRGGLEMPSSRCRLRAEDPSDGPARGGISLYMRVADAFGLSRAAISSKQFSPHCILSYYGLPRTATLMHETVTMVFAAHLLDLTAELK